MTQPGTRQGAMAELSKLDVKDSYSDVLTKLNQSWSKPRVLDWDFALEMIPAVTVPAGTAAVLVSQ